MDIDYEQTHSLQKIGTQILKTLNSVLTSMSLGDVKFLCDAKYQIPFDCRLRIVITEGYISIDAENFASVILQ